MHIAPRLLVATSAVAVLAGSLGATAPGHAEPSWLSDVTTVWTGQLNAPDLALDADGDAVVVWSGSVDGTWSVLAATRPAGGSWSRPQVLSRAPRATEPQVAVDEAGRAVAVWRESTASASVVQSAILVDGDWTWGQTLSEDGFHVFEPQVAVSADGQVAIGWTRNNATLNDRAVHAAVGEIGGRWQVSMLSPTGAHSVDIGVADDGSAAAVWQQGGTVVGASGTPAGVWTAPQQLSTRPALSPSVAVSPSGDAVALWLTSGLGGTSPGIQSASLPADAAWTPAQDLTAPGHFAWNAELGMNRDGDALAAWTVSAPGAPHVVQAARRGTDGRWSVTTVSDPATSANGAQVAFGSGRTSAVLWSASADPMQAGGVWTSTASEGGEWAAPTRITEDSESAVPGDLAVDGDGNALVVWQRAGLDSALRSRAFDGVGPVITPQQEIVTGTPGARLRYAVKAKDAWSEVEGLRWTFSDGARSRGTRATHRYARPGVYGVEVRATDSVGNATTSELMTVVADRRPTIERLRLTRGAARLRLAAPAVLTLRLVDRRTGDVAGSVVVARAAGSRSVRLPEVDPGRYLAKVTASNAVGRSAAKAGVVVRG